MESNTVIRKYVGQYFPHLLNKLGAEDDSNLNRPLTPAVHQPLGYYDAGMGTYTSPQNKLISLMSHLADIVDGEDVHRSIDI